MAQTEEGALKIAAQKLNVRVEDYLALKASGKKHCYKCREWREVGEFCKDSSRYDGLSSKCSYCRRVKEKKSTKGRTSTFRGKHHTDASKTKMICAKKGRKSKRAGCRHSLETRVKISEACRKNTPRGQYHYAFSHGRSQRAFDDRRKPEYARWRSAVFARDNYTCQDCGNSKGGNLRAHHIKPFAEYVDLRFSISNGLTLCHKCHELRHVKPDSIRRVRKLKRGEALWH